jgi:hypothetical protein
MKNQIAIHTINAISKKFNFLFQLFHNINLWDNSYHSKTTSVCICRLWTSSYDQMDYLKYKVCRNQTFLCGGMTIFSNLENQK